MSLIQIFGSMLFGSSTLEMLNETEFSARGVENMSNEFLLSSDHLGAEYEPITSQGERFAAQEGDAWL